MPISGIWGDLLGKDAFSKYGINLWWEKVHAACNTLYVFLLFAFGLFSMIERPACLPTNNNASIFKPARQDEFISSFCANDIPLTSDIVVICILIIYCALVAEFLSLFFVKKWLGHSLSLFSKAEAQHVELKLSLEDMKLLVIQPNILMKISENSAVSQLREIFSHFKKCSKQNLPRLYAYREIYICAFLIVNALTAVYFTLHGVYGNHVFGCKFEDTQNLYSDTNGTLNFVCTLTRRGHDIIAIYALISIFHWGFRTIGMTIVRARYLKFRKKNTVFFLRTLWDFGRTPQKQQFGQLVDFVFSEDCLEALKKNIALVGTCADIQLTKMAEAFIGLENVSPKTNLQGLIENKRWDLIVALLEKFPKPFDDISPLEQVDVLALDTRGILDILNDGNGNIENHALLNAPCEIQGHSLLFYALNREQGSATFHMRAAKRILECTQRRERVVVCYNGGQVSAKEFVELQHASDPTYPDRIKDKLLELIDSVEEPRVTGSN